MGRKWAYNSRVHVDGSVMQMKTEILTHKERLPCNNGIPMVRRWVITATRSENEQNVMQTKIVPFLDPEDDYKSKSRQKRLLM